MASIVMPFAPTRDALEAALAHARMGQPAWVAVHGRVDVSALFALEAPVGTAFAWQGPDGVAWRAIGEARRWETRLGPAAAELPDACRRTLATDVFGTREALAMARGFGTLAFDLRPGAEETLRGRFVLPAWLLKQGPDGTEALVLSPVHGDDDEAAAMARAENAWTRMVGWATKPATQTGWAPMTAQSDADSRMAWDSAITQALELIASGTISKVVLARALPLEADGPVPHGAVFAALAAQAPGTYRFWSTDGSESFMGASPELLFHAEGTTLRADCLAGTIRRGADPEDDEALGRALLASAKDRHEHALVAEAIASVLAPLAENLRMADTPALRRLPNVQHLHTPVEATLHADTSIGAILDAMHPTPAVGGTPRELAIPLIRELEAQPRGWYAGPVGWVSREAAEFAVAIRSATLAGDRATVWAGAGIVAGSEPAAEWDETARKAMPLVRLLTREDGRR